MSYLSAQVKIQIDAPELEPAEILKKLQEALNTLCSDLDREIVHCFVSYSIPTTVSEI